MLHKPHPHTRIHIEPYEVDLRLDQLGVSRAPFVEAARQGDLQRRLATEDDFYATAGYTGWARSLRVLRQETRALHQWHKGDFLRIPVTYNTDETIAVAVSMGDECTGLPGEDPTTNAKGPSTVIAVEEASQGALNFDADETGVDLWYLLTFATPDDELRAELSRPRFTDEQFKISGWHERILFGRLDPDQDARIKHPIASDPTITVRRKSA